MKGVGEATGWKARTWAMTRVRRLEGMAIARVKVGSGGLGQVLRTKGEVPREGAVPGLPEMMMKKMRTMRTMRRWRSER